MRYIIIDVKKKQVRMEGGPGGGSGSCGDEALSLKFMQDTVGGYIEFVTTLPNADTLYVNENGILDPKVTKKGAFRFEGVDQVLAGNGIICGMNEDGDSTPVKSDVEEIKKLVRFQ